MKKILFLTACFLAINGPMATSSDLNPHEDSQSKKNIACHGTPLISDVAEPLTNATLRYKNFLAYYGQQEGQFVALISLKGLLGIDILRTLINQKGTTSSFNEIMADYITIGIQQLSRRLAHVKKARFFTPATSPNDYTLLAAATDADYTAQIQSAESSYNNFTKSARAKLTQKLRDLENTYDKNITIAEGNLFTLAAKETDIYQQQLRLLGTNAARLLKSENSSSFDRINARADRQRCAIDRDYNVTINNLIRSYTQKNQSLKAHYDQDEFDLKEEHRIDIININKKYRIFMDSLYEKYSALNTCLEKSLKYFKSLDT